MTAISSASRVTVPVSWPLTIASTTRPASTGVATASSAVTTLSSRNRYSCRRCGRAKEAIRRRVAREKGLRSCWAFIALCSDVHAVTSMSMRGASGIWWADAVPVGLPGPGRTHNAKTSTKLEVNPYSCSSPGNDRGPACHSCAVGTVRRRGSVLEVPMPRRASGSRTPEGTDGAREGVRAGDLPGGRAGWPSARDDGPAGTA